MDKEIKNEFEAAKEISELLKGFERNRQGLILGWVAESLNIKAPAEPTKPDVASSIDAISSAERTVQSVTDIKTFVDTKSPKSDVQFATVVAYFYRFEAPVDQQKESISADVLKEATRMVNWRRLKDPLKTLNNAKGQGYLDAGDRGQYRINSVGENLVAMTLPGAIATKPARAASNRSRAKGKTRKISRSKAVKPKRKAVTRRPAQKRR